MGIEVAWERGGQEKRKEEGKRRRDQRETRDGRRRKGRKIRCWSIRETEENASNNMRSKKFDERRTRKGEVSSNPISYQIYIHLLPLLCIIMAIYIGPFLF